MNIAIIENNNFYRESLKTALNQIVDFKVSFDSDDLNSFFHHEGHKRARRFSFVYLRVLCGESIYLPNMKVIITKISAPITATNPIKLKIFCSTSQRLRFSSRLKKKFLNGYGVFSLVRLL